MNFEAKMRNSLSSSSAWGRVGGVAVKGKNAAEAFFLGWVEKARGKKFLGLLAWVEIEGFSRRISDLSKGVEKKGRREKLSLETS